MNNIYIRLEMDVTGRGEAVVSGEWGVVNCF